MSTETEGGGEGAVERESEGIKNPEIKIRLQDCRIAGLSSNIEIQTSYFNVIKIMDG